MSRRCPNGTGSVPNFHNAAGQPSQDVDPDGVSTLTIYNPLGKPAFAVTDTNRDGVVDWSGGDHITWTTNYVVNNGVSDVYRSETRVWQTNGVNVSTLVSVNESAVNGLLNWSASFGLTNRSETSYPGGGVRYSKSFVPDGTFTTTRFENGQVTASTRTNGSTQLSATSFGYDEHGRQKFVTDARNGTTTKKGVKKGSKKGSVPTIDNGATVSQAWLHGAPSASAISGRDLSRHESRGSPGTHFQ